MRKLILVAGATLALMTPAMAGGSSVQTKSNDTIKVEPGNSPTKAMDQETPTMQGDPNKDEHAATNRVDKVVPPMKETDKKTESESKSTTTTN
ncbi:MAG: hypothetical protein AB7S41_13215 [Parvibaculaceae bacterium]